MAKIPKELFDMIEKVMPFSSVDIIIIKDEKIILTKRSIPPFKGYWHLPGSVIMKNEKVAKAVTRCAKEELGVEVKVESFIKYYDLFLEKRHYITHLFITKFLDGKISLNSDNSDIMLISMDEIPKDMIPAHRQILEENSDAIKQYLQILH